MKDWRRPNKEKNPNSTCLTPDFPIHLKRPICEDSPFRPLSLLKTAGYTLKIDAVFPPNMALEEQKGNLSDL